MPKKEEELFLERVNKFELYQFWICSVFTSCILVLSGIYATIEEGIVGDGGAVLLMSFMFISVGIFSAYKFLGSKIIEQSKSKNTVKYISGVLRVEFAPFSSKFKIEEKKVNIPSHWERYINVNEPNNLEVYFGVHKNYAVKLKKNISIYREIEKGYDEIFHYRPKRYFLVLLFFFFFFGTLVIFSGFVLVNLGVMGNPDISHPKNISGFFNNWFEYGPMVLMVGSGIPSTWYIYRHFKQLSAVREMYEEEMGLEPA